ncbi:hypothetical protein B566_EDAN015641 [Ephemera danica]|nr:hypothetical protein B566_EDAN015641 [Ephemera danica]
MTRAKMRIFFVFLVTFMIVVLELVTAQKKLVCYYGSWATYRPGNGKFDVENLNASLCTHAIYSFIGAIKRFNNLRLSNPNLKTLVAIGGWNAGSTTFSSVCGNTALRAKFVDNLYNFVKQYGFNGLDLDWEYPAQRGGIAADKDATVKYWLQQGAPASKLVLGIPLYGRTWTLKSATSMSLGAGAIGPGAKGPYTQESGFLGYNEICEMQKTGSWITKWEPQQQVPYTYKNTLWVGYDNINSIKIKPCKQTQYVNNQNLAGAMVWSVETDDFRNICGAGKFPLLNAIKSTLA